MTPLRLSREKNPDVQGVALCKTLVIFSDLNINKSCVAYSASVMLVYII